LETAHGYYPLYRDASETKTVLTHFGHRIDICPPPLPAAAKLLYFSRRESLPLEVPAGVPRDREHANQLGITRGQTQADLIEVNSHKGAKVVPPTHWDWKDALKPEELELEEQGTWTLDLKAASAQWDNDWERLTNCWDPWSQPELKGVVYTPGMMDGLWQGRILVRMSSWSFFYLIRR